MKRSSFYIFLTILIVESLFLVLYCNRAPEVITTTTTDTIPGDSVPYLVTIEKPIPHYIDTGSWNYYPIDTLAVLKDYLSRVVYIDTLMDDSSAFICLIDTIHKNRIQGRSFYFANRKPTAIINNTTITPVKEDKTTLYAGAFMAAMPGRGADAGPAIMITTPRGQAYSYAYGISQKTHTLTFVLRIRLNRKVPPD